MSNLKQSGLVLTTIFCEFFSYFGIRALLILYLVKHLNFSDASAYSLFGGFTALIFLTPIVGGYIADRFLGFYRSVMMGVILIIMGEVLLMLPGTVAFYSALSLLVVGLGFFKTNAICLYQQYLNDTQSKNSALSIYYVALNLGGSLGPLVNGFVMEYYGYEWAFLLAAIMMLLGLLALKLVQKKPLPKLQYKNIYMMLFSVIVSAALIGVVLYESWSGYLVLLATIVALIGCGVIFKGCGKRQRRKLLMIFVLTLLSTVYWIFDQQGGSSVMLFISRNVDKGWLPTASFSGVSSLGAVLLGLLLAWFWQRSKKRGGELRSSLKLLIGFVFLGSGFALLVWGAKMAMMGGDCSWVYPLLGLALISMGELFTDPVIVSEIAQNAPSKNLGFLTGVYFLFVGAVANYSAGWVAQLTAVSKTALSKTNLQIVAKHYATGFEWMLLAVLAASFGVLLLSFYSVIRDKKECLR